MRQSFVFSSNRDNLKHQIDICNNVDFLHLWQPNNMRLFLASSIASLAWLLSNISQGIYPISYSIVSKNLSTRVTRTIVQCTLYSVQCTVYIVRCALYSVQCTVYNLQWTVFTVQSEFYNIWLKLFRNLYTLHSKLYGVQYSTVQYITAYSVQHTVKILENRIYSVQLGGGIKGS